MHFVLTMIVLAGLGWTLWSGFQKHEETAAESVIAPATGEPVEHTASGRSVLKLGEGSITMLGLESTSAKPLTSTPRRQGYGRVLDPIPLVILDSDMAASEAALTASRAEHERSVKLLSLGENTSRKAAEAAEASFRADEIKRDFLHRTAQIQWGEFFARMTPQERRHFTGKLATGETAIVRIGLLSGTFSGELPHAATLLVSGHDAQPITTSQISPAPDSDPKTQTEGLLLQVERPPFSLRPGMAVTAWVDSPASTLKGFGIPDSAILRHQGGTWIFVKRGKDGFVRKPVTLGFPLSGNRDWFIHTEPEGLNPGEELITSGAQMLLSEEIKATDLAIEPE